MFKTVKSITRVPFLLLFVFVTYVHIFYVKTYGKGKAETVYKIILTNIQKSVVGNVVSDIRIGRGKNKAGDGFMDFGSIIASCKNEINDMLGDVIPSTITESLFRENHPKRVAEINNICDKLNSKFFKDEEGKIIKQPLLYITREGFWRFTDNVIETLKKITEGAIKRPKADIHKVLTNDTEMVKLNPNKAEDELYSFAEDLVKEGVSQKDAEKIIYQRYVNSYHINNKDADF